ncbi:MAG: phage terminase small subunit P27 family [Synergistaceae bacterium]|nr:phage terminase small subunit P27 family [Synergistaceae bacterium]
MATRGRKPKPDAVKKLGGRSHKKKEAPLVELPIDAMHEDSYLSIPQGRELWESLVEAGVARKSDRQAFARYIDLLEVYAKAYSDVAVRGAVLNVGKSEERYNPSWRIMRDAQAELLKLEAEFGLTPSAKQRVMKMAGDRSTEEDDGYAAIRGGKA